MDDKGRPLDILLATPYKMGVGGISQWADNIFGYYQSLDNPGVRSFISGVFDYCISDDWPQWNTLRL